VLFARNLLKKHLTIPNVECSIVLGRGFLAAQLVGLSASKEQGVVLIVAEMCLVSGVKDQY